MELTHKVRINVAREDGSKETVLTGGICHLPYRLLRFLFGGSAQVLVLKPGQTVDSVEVRQLGSDDRLACSWRSEADA